MATGQVAADRTASEAATCRVAVAGIGTPLEEAREDSTDPAPAPAAAVAPPAWDLEAEEASAAAGGAGKQFGSQKEFTGAPI